MKKILIILLLFLAPTLVITACSSNKKDDDSTEIDNNKDDNNDQDKKDEEKNQRKWSEFNGKIEEKFKNDFTVKNHIEKILEKSFESNSSFASDQLSKYKKLEKEFRGLPSIKDNEYKEKIDKIFKTLSLWIMYLNGDNKADNLKSYPGNLRKLTDIFNGINGNSLGDMITIKNKDINDKFGNWDYKNHAESTKIKFLEFIHYHDYITRDYIRILNDIGNNQKNGITFSVNLDIKTDQKNAYFGREFVNKWETKITNRNLPWIDNNKRLVI